MVDELVGDGFEAVRKGKRWDLFIGEHEVEHVDSISFMASHEPYITTVYHGPDGSIIPTYDDGTKEVACSIKEWSGKRRHAMCTVRKRG